jgi:hypothetical protein
MPRYTVVCRGSLIINKSARPTGSVVEMSEAAAASLPFGTVELLIESPAPVVAVPAAPVVPIAAKPAPKPSHVAAKAKDSKS